MKEVKEALKKRINGSLGQASHYEEQAKQLRSDAAKLDEDAKQMRSEAAELNRIVVAIYGDK